jgi:DNA-binding response OmpR family regulator
MKEAGEMSDALHGLRVLIAEDELLLALDLEDMLLEAGCEVIGPARTLAAAEELAEKEAGIAMALLDLNLAGESSLPLARGMIQRGIPVILTTGYEEADLPGDLPASKICVKPLSSGQLLRAMHALLAEAEGNS